MELYDKKFFINGNCMIRSFGQPGLFPFLFSKSSVVVGAEEFTGLLSK